MIPLKWYIWNSKIRRNKKWNSGCQRLGERRHGELLINGYIVLHKQDYPIILKSLRETMSSQRQGSYYLPLCSSPQQSVLTYCKCLRNVCGINEWVDPLIDQEKDHSSREQSSTFWTQTQAQSCWLDYNLHSWKFVSVISCCVTNYTQSLRT